MGQQHDELLERATLLPALKVGSAGSVVARKAQGPKVYDLDNIGYIDYLGGGGSSIVGFANQFVLDAVKKVLDFGVPHGFHVAQEVELVEKLAQFLPWVGCWCLCRNHDEAMRMVLAWARRRSGRERILALAGGADLQLGVAGRGPDGDPAMREIPSWRTGRIVDAVRDDSENTAALVLEPLMTRFGLIPLEPDAVAEIADACRAQGVLLVLDERVSGFRLARGGAAAWAGITPDAAVYGPALGGGFPIGAFGINAEHGGAEAFGPEVSASPHPVSLAAAEAVLSILKNDTTYARLEERSAQLADGIRNLADRFQRSIVVNRVGSVFALYLGVTEVASGSAARGADGDGYRRLARGLRGEGVLLPPVQGGPAFVSAAHGAKDIEATLSGFEKVLLRFHQEDLP
jgi:glutamate-1-semialdehyde 2,1-aminomutase